MLLGGDAIGFDLEWIVAVGVTGDQPHPGGSKQVGGAHEESPSLELAYVNSLVDWKSVVR